MSISSLFLSTLSLRRATEQKTLHAARLVISIHALLAESDLAGPSGPAFLYNFYPRSPCGERRVWMGGLSCDGNFYPRSPCGERPCTMTTIISIALFLSTLSLRRATVRVKIFRMLCPISIHALLAESDKRGEHHASSQQEFLSTLSLRRATAKVHKTVGHFCTYETNFMGIASSC